MMLYVLQWLILYKKSEDDEAKAKTAKGLDVDIDSKTAQKIIKSATKFTGKEPADWQYYSQYGFKTLGGNHKGKAMKAALSVLPTVKELQRQEVKVFYGLSLQQQRKVCSMLRNQSRDVTVGHC
jgi:hypothetical protein